MTLYHLALCRLLNDCPTDEAVPTDAVRAACGCALFEPHRRSLS